MNANRTPRHRYVVLHHEDIAEPHFDLMIESSPGGGLLTWRSSSWPIDAEVQLIQLGEHRRDYLEYEGPISGDRGFVKRVAGGDCVVRWTSAGECNIDFQAGGLRFRQIAGERWTAAPSNE